MFGKSAKIKELECRVHDLDLMIATRGQWLKNKDEEIARLNDQIKQSIIDSPIYFDFKNVKVFSIERLSNEKTGWKTNTSIGFILSNGPDCFKVHEWYFECSQAQHDKLVADFETSKNITS